MDEETNKLLLNYGNIRAIVKQIFCCIERKKKQKQDSVNMLKELKNMLTEIKNIQSNITNNK